MTAIKVLFVYSDRYCFCTVKRCLEIVVGLWRYHKGEVEAKAIYYDNLVEEHFQKFDVILFQRVGANNAVLSDRYKMWLERMISRYRGRCRFIYEIDDFLLSFHRGTPTWLAQLCDLALLPNEFLEKEMSRYQKSCRIIRTHVDFDSTDKIQPLDTLDKTRFHVGWFTISGNGIQVVQTLFEKLASLNFKKSPLFHMVCDPYFHPSIRKAIPDENFLTLYPLLPKTVLYQYMKSMDCLINPLVHHSDLKKIYRFDEATCEKLIQGKSEIKYVLAGAFAKPLITTPIEAYRTAIRDGENGFLASTVEEWEERLTILLKDPEKARQIGQQAFTDSREHYSLQKVAKDYLKVFQDIGTMRVINP